MSTAPTASAPTVLVNIGGIDIRINLADAEKVHRAHYAWLDLGEGTSLHLVHPNNPSQSVRRFEDSILNLYPPRDPGKLVIAGNKCAAQIVKGNDYSRANLQILVK